MLATAAGLVWFLLQPRRLQTLENVPAVVDEKLRAHHPIETTEDPREVRPIALAAAKRAGDVRTEGNNRSKEQSTEGQAHHEGPLNSQ